MKEERTGKKGPARAPRAGPAVFLAALFAAVPAAAARGPLTAILYGPAAPSSPAPGDERLATWARASVALFRAEDLAPAGPGALAPRAVDAGRRFGLCPDEPFAGQPSASYCSGALVGPDLVLTAAHCFHQTACRDVRFVFGWAGGPDGRVPSAFPREDVYSCAAVVAREDVSGVDDWALVRLDRPAVGRAPLAVDRADSLAEGTPLLMLGHPSGLPLRVSGPARVADASPATYFVSGLDDYAGDSGAPVLDARSGLLLGVFDYDEAGVDYVPRGECRVSTRCPDAGCVGARATKAAAFEAYVP